MEDGYTNEQLFEFTNMDPWFLAQFRGLHEVEEWLKSCKLGDLSFDDMYEVKRKGFSDAQLARFFGEITGCRVRNGPVSGLTCPSIHNKLRCACSNIESYLAAQAEAEGLMLMLAAPQCLPLKCSLPGTIVRPTLMLSSYPLN